MTQNPSKNALEASTVAQQR